LVEENEQFGSLPEGVRNVLLDARRLDVLRQIDVWIGEKDAGFDALTRLAASILTAPAAFIATVGPERLQFRSSLGWGVEEASAAHSFCAHTISRNRPMIVEDAVSDPRFSANPFVTGDPRVRFYAGAPIRVRGQMIGTIAVLDEALRQRLTAGQVEQLESLAMLAASLFDLKETRRQGEKAERALWREEKRHALALKAASVASWIWDVKAGTFECDNLLPKLFNLPPAGRIAASDIFRRVDPRDVRKTEMRLREALAGEEDYAAEFRLRHSDPPRWLAGRGRVVERDAAGRPLLVIGVNFDISERKSAEERQRLLLRELNHRVKNTLATVQALASQTVRHAREPQAFLEGFGSRLQALGAAHGLLTDREWHDIELGELIDLEITPFVKDEEHRIRVGGHQVYLSPDQAVAIGLIIHELADNAIKYGALSTAEGHVDLDWHVARVAEGKRLVLAWRERGGPSVTPPEAYGFGSILIRRSLGKILSSDVKHDFAPDGVRAEISLLLDKS
jgi:two-component sensor histidine kinase